MGCVMIYLMSDAAAVQCLIHLGVPLMWLEVIFSTKASALLTFPMTISVQGGTSHQPRVEMLFAIRWRIVDVAAETQGDLGRGSMVFVASYRVNLGEVGTNHYLLEMTLTMFSLIGLAIFVGLIQIYFDQVMTPNERVIKILQF